jgi:hypothetical protein
MAWLHMAHVGDLPPIWDLLDHSPAAEILHLLCLVEFTDLLNGCSPNALVRNAFMILRMVATARYFHLKSQELPMRPSERLWRRSTCKDRPQLPMPAPSTQPQHRCQHQLAAMSSKHHEVLATAAFNAERARLAEWKAGQLRGQIGLALHDLARARNYLTTSPHASGGPERSVEGERSGGARDFGPLQPAGDKPR